MWMFIVQSELELNMEFPGLFNSLNVTHREEGTEYHIQNKNKKENCHILYNLRRRILIQL